MKKLDGSAVSKIIRACWLSRADQSHNLIASGSPDLCPLSEGALPFWQRVFYWIKR
jgi:hypothetical protein